jgi:hypothetical protein
VKAPRLVLVPVAVVAALTMSGCAHSSNTAAEVGGTTITKADVDLLSNYQCDLINSAAKDPSQQVSPITMDKVRTYIATALINNALDDQLIKKTKVKVSPSLYKADLASAEASGKTVPARDRDRFNALALDSIRAGYGIQVLANSELEASGTTQPTEDQITAAVTALRNSFRKGVKIDVNPIYGLGADGATTVVDPSASKAVTSFAKDTVAASPSAAFLTSLAPGQTCG